MKWLTSFFDHQLVGLDLGVSGIKAIEISASKSPRLIAYNRLPFPTNTVSPDGEIREPDVVINALKKLFSFKGFTTKRVAVGAFGNSIITKKITLPRMSASELSEQLYWEAEQYIPFSINDVNLDFAILGNSSQKGETPMMDVLLVAAKKDYVGQLISVLEAAGLKPEIVDSQAFALGNSFEFNYASHVNSQGQLGVNAIIDFGAGTTKISVVEEDKTVFTREIRKSGIACTEAISKGLGVSFEEAEKLKIGQGESDSQVKKIIEDFNSQITQEIQRAIDIFLSQSTDRNIQAVYVCGGASRTVGLLEALETSLPIPTLRLNPIQNILGSGKKMNAEAIREISFLGAVAVGLSLRTFGDSK